MKVRKLLLSLLMLIIALAVTVGIIYAIYLRPFMRDMMVMKTIHYDKNFTIVTGGGGNSGILTSDSVVLIVDTKMKDGIKPFYDSVMQVAGNKHIIIVNTHIHSDHVGGNSMYKGATIIAGGNYDKAQWSKENGEESLPTQWVKDSLIIHVGDETVTILNLNFPAHTQSDVFVYLQNRKVLFTGDVVLNASAPALFSQYKASTKGYLAAFDTIEHRFDIKTVVPGHGAIGGKEVIDNYRTFFEDMYVAALDKDKKGPLMAKYKSWRQIPVLMSPDATVSYIKGEKGK
jgi:cyclase